MVRVCIEVDCGEASSTTLYVRAESILRALEVAGEQNPGCALKVVFPSTLIPSSSGCFGGGRSRGTREIAALELTPNHADGC